MSECVMFSVHTPSQKLILLETRYLLSFMMFMLNVSCT